MTGLKAKLMVKKQETKTILMVGIGDAHSPNDKNDVIQDADAKVSFAPAALPINNRSSVGGISAAGDNLG